MTIPYRGNLPPIDDEVLSAYLDGQVSPDEYATVEAAIAADAAVRARATDLRATRALLRALPQPALRRTFILTPEQAAAIRPVHTSWVIRLFPTITAVGAVAAVLCLVLLGGDLATGGFVTKQRQTVSSRPAIESVSAVAVTQATTAALAPVAAAATPIPSPVVATSLPAQAAGAARAPDPAPVSAAARAADGSAPAATGALVAPTGTAVFASGGAPVSSAAASQAITPTVPIPTVSAPVLPTAVADVQPPPAPASIPPRGGAVVTRETHRVPIALVRVGEILLALLAVAGLTLAVLGWRRRAALRAR